MKNNIFKGIMALLLCLTSLSAAAQAKKPTLMVFPGDVWCASNGFTKNMNNNGRVVTEPDYERAVSENADLLNVITKIGELMAERQFPLKDLASEIRNLNRAETEDEFTVSSTSGAELAETALERLQRRAKSDIRVEVVWTVNNQGPKRSVTYNLRGIDSYTNKQIAAAQGTGPASFSTELPVLLEEAVIEKMDGFLAQLMEHFNDMAANGRECTLKLQMFNNGQGLSFEKMYGDSELSEIIEQWVNDNTVQHRFNLTDVSENVMLFEQVRIPLYNSKGRAMDARMFARELQKYLTKAPYNITSKIKAGGGLGTATLIIGEK